MEEKLDVVNMYIYLGFGFSKKTTTNKLRINNAVNEMMIKAKRGTTEILTTMGKPKCYSARVLFKLFDTRAS